MMTHCIINGNGQVSQQVLFYSTAKLDVLGVELIYRRERTYYFISLQSLGEAGTSTSKRLV
jgi:hypothetical protein